MKEPVPMHSRESQSSDVSAARNRQDLRPFQAIILLCIVRIKLADCPAAK